MDSWKWLIVCHRYSMSAWCITGKKKDVSSVTLCSEPEKTLTPLFFLPVADLKKKVQRRRWWTEGYQIAKRFEKEGESADQQTHSRRLVKKKKKGHKKERFQHRRSRDVKREWFRVKLSPLSSLRRGLFVLQKHNELRHLCVREEVM